MFRLLRLISYPQLRASRGSVAGEKAHAAVPPVDVVNATVGALGRQPSVIVGTMNAFRAFTLRFAPRALVARLAETMMRENIPEHAR